MTQNERSIPFGRPWITDEDRQAVLKVLDGPILVHGPESKAFEAEFAEFLGEGANCVSVSSGMAALHLACMHFGFGPGDEVIVPAQTHTATANAVELTGAKPVFVDCDPATGNVTREQISKAITPRTKGVIVVHFVGIPCDMPEIVALAGQYGLKVIEDCAVALGARWGGKHVGLFGDAGCFSFYPVKHITTGEGGMFVSRHREVAEAVATFRAHGVDRAHGERKISGMYDVKSVGMNYRLAEIPSALGRRQLLRLDEILARRRENFQLLKRGLAEIPGLRVIDATSPEAQQSFYCLSAVLAGELGRRRDEIVQKLNGAGIGTSIYYPQPVPRMSYYRNKYGYDSEMFEAAAEISDQSIALPVGPHVSQDDVRYIIETFNHLIKGNPNNSMNPDTMPIRDRRVVIIGGAGFIGHNLALALKERGADVAVVDSLQVNNLLSFTSAEPDLPNRDLYLAILNQRLDLLREAKIPLYPQDVRDYHALSRIFSQLKPQVVIHLAAVAHAGRSNKDPHSTFDHSLRTLENALDCARGNVEQFIYFSSSMAYGNFKTEEVTEEHPLEPIGIYGALKLAGEKIVIAYNQVFGLPYTIVRPSALYGPRCVSRRVGQIFIESALNGGKLHIEGDGSERVDFTSIEDLTSGVTLIMENPAAKNQIFNLTYGQSRSIRELAAIIQQRFPEVEVRHVERDNLTPYRGTLSVRKARELIGYTPRVPIEIGIPRYIEWYKTLGHLPMLPDLSA